MANGTRNPTRKQPQVEAEQSATKTEISSKSTIQRVTSLGDLVQNPLYFLVLSSFAPHIECSITLLIYIDSDNIKLFDLYNPVIVQFGNHHYGLINSPA
jgi:hypothetical protein